MARIYDQLQNASLEPITTGTLPSAAANTYRVFFNTTTNKVVVSDGTNWITSGDDYIIQTFKLNGRVDYSSDLSNLIRIDGAYAIPFNATVENVIIKAGCHMEVSTIFGSVTEIITLTPNLHYGAEPYTGTLSVFSNTPTLIRSATATSPLSPVNNTRIRGIDVLGNFPAVDGATAPTLGVTSVTAGNYFWFDIDNFVDTDVTSSTNYMEDIQCTVVLRRS